ncbi:MAG: DUF1648 domain-containing protein [Coleofasciculaceae cyanobacterium SM2_1_6]|nr:DUF1648 domain-containing protein [Coleofasciculaceae cyanobacterium SM2_1_6]
MKFSSKKNQPVLEMDRSPQEAMLDLVAIAGIVASFVVVITNWETLPDRIPTHFDFAGNVNRFSPKNILWIFSLSSTFSFFLLKVISRYPHTFNYPIAITPENAAVQYRLALNMMYWLRAEMIWLFTLIQWQMIAVAKSPSDRFNSLVVFLLLVIVFCTVGVYLWRAWQARS